jgi:signal transduction histidine kinase
MYQRLIEVDGSSKRSFGGAGLGLALPRHLFALVGGTIGVESEPGKGSCFCFVLPLAAVSGASAS